MNTNYMKSIYNKIIKSSQTPDLKNAFFTFVQQEIPNDSNIIYIIQFGRIGETVWGIQAVNKLCEQFRDKRIVFVIQESQKGLFTKEYCFEITYWDFDCFKKMINILTTSHHAIIINLGRNNISRVCSGYLKELTECTVIGATQSEDRITIYGNDYTIVSQLKSSQYINYLHESELLLRKIGLKGKYNFPQAEPKCYKGGMIAIAAGASNPIRLWGINKFVQLIKLINEKAQAHYVVLGNSMEISEFKKYSSSLENVKCEYAENKCLEMQIEILKTCDFLICNDSGWMHIAENINIMTICIAGPTSPYGTGCYFSEGISICADIKCRPCYEIECDSQQCEKELRVESVYKIVHAWMEKKAPLIGANIIVVHRKNGKWDEWCFSPSIKRITEYVLKRITIYTMCESEKAFQNEKIISQPVKRELNEIANNVQMIKKFIEEFVKYDLLGAYVAEKIVLVNQIYEQIAMKNQYIYAVFEFLLVKNGFWDTEDRFDIEDFLDQFVHKLDCITKALKETVDDR